MKYIVIRIDDTLVEAITDDLAEVTSSFGVWGESEAKEAILKLPGQTFIKKKR